MNSPIQQETDRLIQWFKNDAIPFWSHASINAETGASCEQLLSNGEIDKKANIRVRVQARQAFFYSVVAHLGWCDQGKTISQGLLRFSENHAAHPTADTGFTHLMDSHFKVIDIKQDLYDHAFFLLAYAWQYRAFGDENALIRAEALVAHLDKLLGAPYGGWMEGDYEYAHRRQNPHMHLFEAFMTLYEASNNAKWLARAGEIFTLFETCFYSPKDGVILEFFTENWSPAAGDVGKIVEPGHMFEWVWLLDWYSRLTGRPVLQYTRSLYEKALSMGYKEDSGLVYDAVNITGEIIDAKKRSWGLTEFIKASLVIAKQGDEKAEAAAVVGVKTLFDYYLCAEIPGSYIDRRGANDEIVEAHAPASTLYHFIVVAMELMNYCKLKNL